MLYVEYEIRNQKVIERYQRIEAAFPGMAQDAVDFAAQKYSEQAYRLLREYPGQPVYPIEWKSRAQQIAVIAKLRAEGNLPYQRSYELADSWVIYPQYGDTDFPAEIVVSNMDEKYRWVQGFNQQPFHRNTGWGLGADILREIGRGFRLSVAKRIHDIFNREFS